MANRFLLKKNPTPEELARFNAILITSAGMIVLIVGFLLIPVQFAWLNLLLSPLVIFCAAYLSIRYTLKHYIYRKIKLIYKSIYHFKRKKEERNEDVDLSRHIIDEVEKEVQDWAESANQEIEALHKMETFRREFMGNVSHELKTPLFSIQGYIDTLLEGGLRDPQVNIRYLKKAAKNAERLVTIVQDLEQISSLEAGGIQLYKQDFDIHVLAGEVIDELEIYAKPKDIKLLIKEGCDRPFMVYADRERIRQVIVNLVSNSIKYGREGGHTKIGFYDMADNILIEVADNGIGIEEEHIPRLFERFYRIDKSRSRDQGGTGLGLAIVKHIIEAHEQTINARSSLALGSTFGFTLKKV